MGYLYNKLFVSSYNFSILKTLWFNLKHYGELRPKIYIGKKTKFFFKGGRLKVKRPVYFDSRNGGQFWHDSSIVLESNSLLKIGEDVNFFSAAQIKCFENALISIGKNSYFSGPIVIHAKKSIKIGERCSISWNVTILDSDFHAIGGDSKDISSKEVVIGNDVWIGANVTILKGVVIQDGAVVAASSVVTKPIGKNEVYAGNPAKLIRKIGA